MVSKKKYFALIVVSVAVICTMFGSMFASPMLGFAADDGIVNNSDSIEGMKIVVFDSYTGFALSDKKADALMRQSQARGIEKSLFITLMEKGVEVVDPTSGLTFLVENGKTVGLKDGANIFVIEKFSSSRLFSGDVTEENFSFNKEIVSSYGTFNLYY
ncbi:hypothetical protein IKD82_01835 [Candidatus Saccharibacteria bacterium]|nr:hypothetical protein [Candidatus Saccharibacteria bacterium]